MSYILGNEAGLSSWILNEISLKSPLKKGKRDRSVRRIQEWLNLHNMGVVIDGDFGRVTEAKVKQFQKEHGIPSTGIVNNKTYNKLVAPLLRVLEPIPVASGGGTLSGLVSSYANAHLSEHPLEVGGQNRGPWVRLYMKGNEGSQWAWCAGFVSFIIKQAAETLQMSAAIPGSFSCDTLAAQGKSTQLFVGESSIKGGTVKISDLPATSIFLVRRTATDWTHTGFVTQFNKDSFDTIEGNTNDDGSREGYEVCARTRGYKNKDFIML